MPTESGVAEPLAQKAETAVEVPRGTMDINQLAALIKPIIEPVTPPKEPEILPAAPEQKESPKQELQDSTEQSAGLDDSGSALSQLDELSDSESKTSPENDGLQKRINKLTAKRREAEEKAGQLEREVNDLKSQLAKAQGTPPIETDPDNPVGDVWEEQILASRWDEARNLKRWCEDNAEGAVIKVEGQERELSAGDVRAIRRKAEDALEKHIPQRANFLVSYKQSIPEAEKLYPWWKDRASEEYQLAQNIVRNFPAIARLPEYMIHIGDLIEGRRARLQKHSPALSKASAAAIKPAPMQPAKNSPQPAQTDMKSANYQQARKSFAQSGSRDALANVLKQTGI